MSSGRRHLEIPFSTPLEDVHVDDLEVRVVLPEGSARIVSELPFDVDKSTETKYSYLDTTGRPVLVFKKKNVVPEHNVNLIVDYR
jgi:oligosaccharyltransferase complex subunit alpha (ribophorin I)